MESVGLAGLLPNIDIPSSIWDTDCPLGKRGIVFAKPRVGRWAVVFLTVAALLSLSLTATAAGLVHYDDYCAGAGYSTYSTPGYSYGAANTATLGEDMCDWVRVKAKYEIYPSGDLVWSSYTPKTGVFTQLVGSYYSRVKNGGHRFYWTSLNYAYKYS